MNRYWPYPGARWWKFDFHTHTPASEDYGKGPKHETQKQITPREWLLGFMRAGVDCVAITDHNSSEWINKLKQALYELGEEQHSDFRPLYLFPGVEVTANGSTHILAIFDPVAGSDDVAKLLGAVGYRGEPGKSQVAAESAPIRVVEEITKAGGIPVLAHVDEADGAWSLPGNTLMPLLDSDWLYAAEVRDVNSERPELYRQRRLAWSEVLGSDSHHPESDGPPRFPGSHYTWVKMATPSVEGLRLALLDGVGFSVRRSDISEPFDPLVLPRHHIQSIELASARYMGNGSPAILRFSPWLNALVGGRGTGKSTVIHGLRLVARRDGELDALDERSTPRLTFQRFNKVHRNRMDEGGLEDTTQIEWSVIRDGVAYRLHWGQGSSKPAVEEESDEGGWFPSNSQLITPERFPIRLFSQGQIAEMAGDNQLPLLQLIDEAAGVAVAKDALDGLRNAFYTTMAQVREIDGKLGREGGLSVELEDVDRKLTSFENTSHSAVLPTFRQGERQQSAVNRRFESVEEIAKSIDETIVGLQLEDMQADLFDNDKAEDQDVIKLFASLAEAVETAANDLREAAKRLREQAQIQRRELANSAWQQALDSAASAYNNLVETLEKDGISSLDEFGPLLQKRELLESEAEVLVSEREKREQLVQSSNEQMSDVLKARGEISVQRASFLSTQLAQNKFVRIGLCPYGNDLRVIERSLRESLNVLDDRFQDDILDLESGRPPRGIVSGLFADLPEEDGERRKIVVNRLADLKRRFEKACAGGGGFGGHFNNYLERSFSQSPDFLDRLMTWFPEDALDIKYSRTGDGRNFQPIAQGSAGQKAAAMLAFLLAHGEEPLVLDQPEDDLDNQLIYDLVVRQIRENKLRRQIIVVTHNPNIVVNGDAEMLHALEFQFGQCVVAQSGSLQEKTIRDKVCQVMEGGREAFERRYKRLGHEMA